MNYYDKKIEMTAPKSTGSFVANLQGATGVGFAENQHVHKDWWQKTISYDDALDQAQRAATDREDILAPVNQIQGSVNADNEFVFMVGDREFKPTDHALQQFSIRSNVPSSSVLRGLRNQQDYDSQDADVMTYLANNALRRLEQDKVFRLRTYTDGTCRAFVTDKYAPIDNRWYLETLQEFMPEGRLSHWKGDEDTIYGNILLPDTLIDYTDDDSDYGGMISIGNCEIGKRRISQTPSLFRSICMNGCIWGQVKGKQIRRRHIGDIDLGELKIEIGENIEYQLPLLPNAITKFLTMRDFENGDVSMKNIIAAVCRDEKKIGKREATEVLGQYAEHENHERNLFGVINAITRAGQAFDNATWLTFDEVGGSLLETTDSRWSAILKRAESMQDADFEKVFMTVA